MCTRSWPSKADFGLCTQSPLTRTMCVTSAARRFVRFLLAREQHSRLVTFPFSSLYVNIGPHIAVQDMLTDVYLHLAYVWHSRSPTQAIVH